MSVFYFTLFFSFPSELILAQITDRNGTKNTEIIEGNEAHNMKTREYDLNGADRGYSRRRRRGMSLAPEEVCKLGIHNLGYQNETCGLEMRTKNEEDATEPVAEGDAIIHGFEKQMSAFTETTTSKRKSFSVSERNEVCNSGIYPVDSEMTAFSDKETQRKLSISALEENGSEKKEKGDESNHKSCKSAISGGSEKRKPKTTTDWLKTPSVYKVGSLNVSNDLFVF